MVSCATGSASVESIGGVVFAPRYDATVSAVDVVDAAIDS